MKIVLNWESSSGVATWESLINPFCLKDFMIEGVSEDELDYINRYLMIDSVK